VGKERNSRSVGNGRQNPQRKFEKERDSKRNRRATGTLGSSASGVGKDRSESLDGVARHHRAKKSDDEKNDDWSVSASKTAKQERLKKKSVTTSPYMLVCCRGSCKGSERGRVFNLARRDKKQKNWGGLRGEKVGAAGGYVELLGKGQRTLFKTGRKSKV